MQSVLCFACKVNLAFSLADARGNQRSVYENEYPRTAKEEQAVSGGTGGRRGDYPADHYLN